MESLEKKREPLWDALRGFAIILVVFAHCIQNGSGTQFSENTLYFSDKIYQLIYSFHMPLFMLVSGYLSYGSVQRANSRQKRRRLLSSRAKGLILPIFLWTAADYARILIVNYINGQPQPEALVFVYFYNAFNNLWFLWAAWWCFLLVYVMHYFFHDNAALYALVFLIFFVLPDGLNLGAYKYMAPFFVAAFYGHGAFDRWMAALDANLKTRAFVTAFIGVCFALLFSFFDEGSFIYLTGYKLVERGSLQGAARQLAIDVYRTAIGFAGSLFFVQILRMALEKLPMRFLGRLGSDSMGIYILSGYLIVFGVQRLGFINEPSYAVNFIEMIGVVLVSLALTELFARVPVLKWFVGK